LGKADLHHIGIWVSDMDEMILFLTDVLGLTLVSRTSRGSMGPGERAFVHAGGTQFFELLSEPNAVARPEMLVHPVGHVIGVPHVCLRVSDIGAVEKRLAAAGMKVSQRISIGDDFVFGRGEAVWFTGPSGVGFELFRFDSERGADAIVRLGDH